MKEVWDTYRRKRRGLDEGCTDRQLIETEGHAECLLNESAKTGRGRKKHTTTLHKRLNAYGQMIVRCNKPNLLPMSVRRKISLKA
jgi:hypothetical protein